MLRSTFIHIPQVGLRTEQQLWANQIYTWCDLLDRKNKYAEGVQHYTPHLALSEHKLHMEDARFFSDRLKPDQHWRLFSEFRHKTAYLDIETTGLGGPKDHITTISLYDGKKIHYYIFGKNLNQFKKDIKRYKILVTYNGKCFDVPFIEREFNLKIHQVQLDLRYILRSLGISGGLKSCEHQLDLERGDLEGIDGYFAVLLWRDYLNGNKKALETLLSYNIVDTINLEKLMIIAYNKKLEALLHPKKSFVSELKMPKQVENPFLADNSTIARIKKRYC